MSLIEDLRKTLTVKVTKRVNELRRLVVDDAYSDVVQKFEGGREGGSLACGITLALST